MPRENRATDRWCRCQAAHLRGTNTCPPLLLCSTQSPDETRVGRSSDRHFMKLMSIVTAALFLALPPALYASDQTKPNVVFILADDMRWNVMSCAGNAVLKTPALDRLATSGTRFANMFVTTSICAVSRASILTGQYARRHGVNDFATRIPNLDATYPMLLQRSGYYVGFVGKWGIAADDRDYFNTCASAFDFWAGEMGQTAYCHERTFNSITDNDAASRTQSLCSCPVVAQHGQGCGPNGPHPAFKDPVHAETEFVPAKIRSFLDQRDPRKPFCLSVSLKAPHGPWQGYAPQFAEDFKGMDIPRPGNVSRAEAERRPAFLRQSLAAPRGFDLANDPEQRNEMFRLYYRLIEGLDSCVGKILHELQSRGLADNTVVIFTSDNGLFAGEHGFSGKWFMHEESLRVPLIIYDPRVPATQRGQTAAGIALNIDIAPTVLSLAGLPAPATMQGKNLLPALRTPDVLLHEEFFYEHLYRHGTKPPDRIEPSAGVRTRDWKYINWVDQTGPGREQLYHLRDDPLEMKDLAADPLHQQQLDQLRKQCQDYRTDLR